jgi:hypothetical protein
MRKSIAPVLLGSLIALTFGSSAQAATTASGTISAAVATAASLTVSNANLTFNSADPETVSSIAPTQGNITVTAKARHAATGDVILSVKAGSALTSGTDTIAISNITWTGNGNMGASGTMATTDQQVGAWVGSGVRTGDLAFRLANSYAYATGTYSATITYTLVLQ